MGWDWGTFNRKARHRRGLSFVEFLGCFFALGSGLALGSFFLGIDMKTMFVSILERAELVDPGFFGSSAEAGQLADGTEYVPGDTRSDDGSASAGWTEEQRLAATQSYWKGLAECIRQDVSHRKLQSQGQRKWRLFEYLSHRRKGHESAARSIEELQPNGVDQSLLAHGEQLLEWHRTGIEVYSEAVRLLSDFPDEQLSGPLAEEWRGSATQHRMEEQLVRKRHNVVASYLEHTYQEGSPFERAF